MAIPLKQSTASQEIPLGYFVDSTDGNTEETGLTIANTDIKVWKSGATTLANKNSGGATHISNGIYYAVLDATDTDTLGPLIVFVHVSGALAVRVECVVLPANNFDSGIAGTDVLQVDVTQWLGTAAATPTVAGVPEVDVTHAGGSAVSASSGLLNANVTQISGDATSADNLESYTDGTTPMPVNVTQISGDATAADNLESYTDGTTPIPANMTQISGDATAADNLESYTDGTAVIPANMEQINTVPITGDGGTGTEFSV